MKSRRSLTALANRAVERAIDGGRHRVSIDEAGRVTILPLGIDPLQADDAALDAEIRGLISEDGHAPH